MSKSRRRFRATRLLSIASALLLLAGTMERANASVFVDWISSDATSATGDLAGTTVTLTFSVLANQPSLDTSDLTGSDFSFSPGSATEESVSYDVGETWSVTFSQPVSDLLLYAAFWRGAFADVASVDYIFDQAFTIESGLTMATQTVTTLTVPGADFHSGIIRFAGPISTLTLSTNSTGQSSQGLTFAAVPEAPAWMFLGVAAVAVVVSALRRR
jgi:hypothetical protein